MAEAKLLNELLILGSCAYQNPSSEKNLWGERWQSCWFRQTYHAHILAGLDCCLLRRNYWIILQSFTISANAYETYRIRWNTSFIFHSQYSSHIVRLFRLMFHRKYTVFQWFASETWIGKLLFLRICVAVIVIHSSEVTWMWLAVIIKTIRTYH